MKHPAFIVPGAMDALQALSTATEQAGLPPNLIQLVQLRASQINGCSVCLDGHAKILKKLNEPDDRIIAVAAWRDTPYFTEPERAALNLTESLTRLADHPDPVPDEIYNEASKHFPDPN
jgi:AhpD family alkylhydroperoxidase